MSLGSRLVAGAAAVPVGPRREVMPFGLGFRNRTEESRRIAHE